MKHFLSSGCTRRLPRYIAVVGAFAASLSLGQIVQAQGADPSYISKSSTGSVTSTATLKPYTSSSASSRAPGESMGDAADIGSPGTTLGALPIDLANVRRIKVGGVLLADAPMRVGNLDILAPIVGDDSSLLAKLGSTASRVAAKNNYSNPNTPTDTQSFQLNLAPRPPIILTVGRATAYINGQEQQLRAAPLVIGGKIWLPIFSIAPLLGAATRLQPDGTLNITPTIQSVEIFPAGGYTVLTVKTSAPITPGTVLQGTNADPAKLYFDFSGYSMGFDAANSTGERVVSAGLNDVQQVRAGMPQTFPDVTRIVLDMKRMAKATVQSMPDRSMFAVLIPNSVTPPKLPPREVTIPDPTEPRPVSSDGTLRGVTIVVDAGHGGHDSGAPGARSLEKNHNLDLARRLRTNLESRGATVLMTRDGDYFIPLQGRVDFANSHHADIFFSIHIDSFLRTSSGTTTHFYTAQSLPLAREVQAELARATGIKSRGVMQSRFFVIRKTWMPSVLTESAFITNPREEAMLTNPNWRQRVANGMAQGIANYVTKYGVRN